MLKRRDPDADDGWSDLDDEELALYVVWAGSADGRFTARRFWAGPARAWLARRRGEAAPETSGALVPNNARACNKSLGCRVTPAASCLDCFPGHCEEHSDAATQGVERRAGSPWIAASQERLAMTEGSRQEAAGVSIFSCPERTGPIARCVRMMLERRARYQRGAARGKQNAAVVATRARDPPAGAEARPATVEWWRLDGARFPARFDGGGWSGATMTACQLRPFVGRAGGEELARAVRQDQRPGAHFDSAQTT